MGEGGFWVESGPPPGELGPPLQGDPAQPETAVSEGAPLTARDGEEIKKQSRSPVPGLGHTRWGRVAGGEGPEVLWACGVLGSSEAH